MLEHRPVKNDQFRAYRLLGKGGFGEVFATQRKETGKMYATKWINKRRAKRKGALRLALNERLLLEEVDSKV